MSDYVFHVSEKLKLILHIIPSRVEELQTTTFIFEFFRIEFYRIYGISRISRI